MIELKQLKAVRHFVKRTFVDSGEVRWDLTNVATGQSHDAVYASSFQWRIFGATPNVTKVAKAYGVHCKRCNDWAPHAEVQPDFECWNCRSVRRYK